MAIFSPEHFAQAPAAPPVDLDAETGRKRPKPRKPKREKPEKFADAATAPDGDETATLGKARQRCARVIGNLQPGRTVHYVTAGAWSNHDLLLHCLETYTGPAAVWACTWGLSDDAIRRMLRVMEAGTITRLAMLLDARVIQHCPQAYQLAVGSGTRLALASVHAKVAVAIAADPDGPAVAIVSSANMNNNPRIEAGVVSTQREIAEFHRDWLEAQIRGGKPFGPEGIV